MSDKVAKSSIPRFAKQPVQGHLSLDTIKVVRNDLSDADLEVTPAKQAACPANTTLRVPAKDKECAEVVEGIGRKPVTSPMLGPSKT